MRYKQLTQAERYQNYALLKAGHAQSEIAMIKDRHKSTVGRNICRNNGLRSYRPKRAQRLTQEHRQTTTQPRICRTVWHNVTRLLRQDRSSEQISLWFRAKIDVSISHELIYQYVFQDKAEGGDLYQHLRSQNDVVSAVAVYGGVSNCDHISIGERPTVVDQRSRTMTDNSTPSFTKAIKRHLLIN